MMVTMSKSGVCAVIVDRDKLDAVFGAGGAAVRQFLSSLVTLGVLKEIPLPVVCAADAVDGQPMVVPAGKAKGEPIVPYGDIVDLYHRLCPKLPKLRGMSDKRRRAIAARWKGLGGNISSFEELFNKAAKSTFLCGGNDRKWFASFDWLLNPTNMAKVLEGNFDDRSGFGAGDGFDTDEFFQAAVSRANRYLDGKRDCGL